jgi:hypothetical protein
MMTKILASLLLLVSKMHLVKTRLYSNLRKPGTTNATIQNTRLLYLVSKSCLSQGAPDTVEERYPF